MQWPIKSIITLQPLNGTRGGGRQPQAGHSPSLLLLVKAFRRMCRFRPFLRKYLLVQSDDDFLKNGTLFFSLAADGDIAFYGAVYVAQLIRMLFMANLTN